MTNHNLAIDLVIEKAYNLTADKVAELEATLYHMGLFELARIVNLQGQFNCGDEYQEYLAAEYVKRSL